MTTTRKSAAVDAIDNSMFNIQYPNCQRGMFSLRQPFKDMETAILPTEQRPASIRNLTPAAVQPTMLPVEEEQRQQVEVIPPRQQSKRSAQVQCSLLKSHARHDMGVQTKFDRERTPDHHHHRYHEKKSQPIYEIWEYESPRIRALPIEEPIRYEEIPIVRPMRQKKPIIEYPDEEEIESDYDEERIIYARQPRKTIKKSYLPPNVRMICVRDDANRVSY